MTHPARTTPSLPVGTACALWLGISAVLETAWATVLDSSEGFAE